MAVAGRVDETNKSAKPSEDGWPLYEHLAHIHLVRKCWLGELDKAAAAALRSTYRKGWEDPIDKFGELRMALEESSAAVRKAVEHALKTGVEKAAG